MGNAQLAGNQRQSLLSSILPIAFQKANRPSFLSSLLGGLGGLAGQAFLPGLATKVLGNPFLDLFKQQLGGPGQGFANQNDFHLGA
jgi:hypothetical protein